MYKMHARISVCTLHSESKNSNTIATPTFGDFLQSRYTYLSVPYFTQPPNHTGRLHNPKCGAFPEHLRRPFAALIPINVFPFYEAFFARALSMLFGHPRAFSPEECRGLEIAQNRVYACDRASPRTQ